jgi:hypothetical protein
LLCPFSHKRNIKMECRLESNYLYLGLRKKEQVSKRPGQGSEQGRVSACVRACIRVHVRVRVYVVCVRARVRACMSVRGI